MERPASPRHLPAHEPLPEAPPPVLRVLTFALLVLVLVYPNGTAAQDRPDRDEQRLIQRVVFDGVDQLSAGEVSGRIVTQPTRCRGLLLQPVCLFTDWHLVAHREYLDEEEVRLDELRIEIHYFRKGFREARADSRVNEVSDGVEVVFTIFEGPVTTIGTRVIHQVEEVLPDRDIRRAELPAEGDRLDIDELEEGIEYLLERLGEAGYLDAAVRDSILIDNGMAELRVTIDPRPRTTVADIEVRGNEQVSDRVIRDGLRIEEGGVLRTHHLLDSQRSLYESNLFYEARLTVPDQPDSAKTVVVDLREAPPRRAEVGGGFNTNEFVQAEATFSHFNWLGGGRRLELRGTVGNLLAPQLSGQGIFQDVTPQQSAFLDDDIFLRPTWAVSAEFRQPGFVAATDRASFGSFANRRSTPGIVVENSYGGTVSYTRRFTYRTPLSISYRYEMTSVQAGDLYFCANHGICESVTINAVRDWNALSPAVLSFHSDQSNDPLSPSRGFRLRASLEHASALTLSDYRYNRFSGSATYYLPIDARGLRVLAGRVRAGWVAPLAGTAEALDLGAVGEDLLHPRKRFYSGGSRSVRGYWENQLGPRVLTVSSTVLQEDAGCDMEEIVAGTCDPAGAPADAFLPRPSGGRTVLEGSIEYRFPLTGALRGAVFVDGGIVGQNLEQLFSEGVGAVTPGFGVRFESPIGPVRADLGIRPARAERLPVITEFVDEDGVRRLVRLDRRFEYDPIEAAGGNGFFQEVIARLRLHLSIGEAL